MDCSTIDQTAAIQISNLVESKKSYFVDAPVSGGVLGSILTVIRQFYIYFLMKIGAANATLTFMIGGDESAFSRFHLIPFSSVKYSLGQRPC